MNDSTSLALTTDQLNQINQYGSAGNWPAMYQYISEQMKAGQIPGWTTEQQYWFQQASYVNAEANGAAPSVQPGAYFIEDMTNIGLAQDGSTVELSTLSNAIAQAVYTDIKQNGFIPPFSDQLSNDISAAINLGGFSIAQWGGSFYYWNFVYSPPNAPPTTQTVGQQIMTSPALTSTFEKNVAQAIVDTFNQFGFGILDNPAFVAAVKQGFGNFSPIGGSGNTSTAKIGATIVLDVVGALMAEHHVLAPSILISLGNLFGETTLVPAANALSSAASHYVVNPLANGLQSVVFNTSSPAAVAGANVTLNGGTGTIQATNGETLDLTYNSAGTQIVGDTWTNAAGAKGTDTYNADGSSTSKTTYESGAYATTTDDSQGNITTDYFTKSGVETSSSWVHSDGSSGTVNLFQDGLSQEPGGGPLSVPQSGATIIQNPDGSYTTIGSNAADAAITTSFAASGTQTGQLSAAGSGVNDLAVASTSQVYSAGAEVTNQYNSAGAFIGDTWVSANPDGSANPAGIAVAWAGATCTSGSEVANASGVIVKNATALDGSTYRDTVELNGSTVSHYDANGVLLSDQWSDTDGSNTTASVTGSDTFNADGSGSGTFTDTRDGTSGTVALNGHGAIVIVNKNASGVVTSEDIWNGDGTYEVAMLNPDGSTQATYDYLANGNVTVADLAPGGSIADQQTVAAGLVINPDGSNFSKVANADGSYTVYYEDAQGDATAFQYGAGGQLTGSYHTTSNGSPTSDWSGTLDDGTNWTSTSNDYTPTYTDAQGNAWTDYENAAGYITGADYVNIAAGTHGYVTYGPNNAVYKVDYAADGTSSDYSNDGQGNIAQDFFDASGNETGDTWQDTDGSHGSDTYNADGSSSGTWVNADGSHGGETDFADGSSISYLVNTDGSKSGETDFANGSYSTYSTTAADVTTTDNYDSNGNVLGSTVQSTSSSGVVTTTSFSGADGSGSVLGTTTADVSASGIETGDSWTLTNGTSGSDIYNSDGSSTSTVNDGQGNATVTTYTGGGTSTSTTTKADGSSISDTRDGQGDVVTDTYAAGGQLTSVTWNSNDITASTQTYSLPDGAKVSTSGVRASRSIEASIVTKTNADGSSSTTISDGLGNTTTTQYGANGSETLHSWQLADGGSGQDIFAADGSSMGEITGANGSVTYIATDAQGNVTPLDAPGSHANQITYMQQSFADQISEYLLGNTGAIFESGALGIQTVQDDDPVIQTSSGTENLTDPTEPAQLVSTQYETTTPAQPIWSTLEGAAFAAQYSNGTVGHYYPAGAVEILSPPTSPPGGGTASQGVVGVKWISGYTAPIATEQTTTQTEQVIEATLSGGVPEIDAGAGNHTIYLGTGQYVFDGNLGANQKIINTGAGNDFIAPNGDTMANASAVQLEVLIPGLDGHPGSINKQGSFINLGAGNDTVLGTTANDTIVCGAGNDFLNGGAGSDTYVVFADTVQGWDTIDDTGEYAPSLNALYPPGINIQSAYSSGVYQAPNTGPHMDESYDTVAFQAGVTLGQLQFSWGVSAQAGGLPVLNISWGGTGGISVVVPSATNRDLGEGIENFTFADGTRLSMDQILALAPPQPGLGSDDVSYSLSTTDSQGNTVTKDYSASGVVLDEGSGRGEPFSLDVSYDYDVFNPDGSHSGYTRASDGSYSEHETSVNGNHLTETDTVYYGRDGTLTGSTASVDNGNGTTTVATYSPLDALINTTTDVFSGGVLTSDVWTNSNGTSGSDTFNADGSSSGRITNADGSYDTYSATADGDTITDSYTSAGVLTSTTPGSTDQTTDAAGHLVIDSYNYTASASGVLHGSYSTYSDDGKGDVEIDYYSATGILISDRWTGSDGSFGTDLYNADGSSSGKAASADGSRGIYDSDAQGDKTTDSYAVDGMLSAVAWSANDGNVTTSTASGPNGSTVTTSTNTFDGSSSVTTTNADSSYSIAIGDGLGDTTTSNYSTAGALTGDTWTLSDGTAGSDTYNADGSSSGSTVNADGSYSNYTNDGQGNAYSAEYNASGAFLHDSWSHSDGSYGTDTFNPATGEATGSDTAATGAGYLSESWDNTNLANGATESKYSKTATDGTVFSSDVITQADGSTAETWSDTDGSYGTDNVNAVTGEATGSDTAAPGAGYLNESWDNTNLANGATESKYSKTATDGTVFSSDVITQADGSTAETWSDTDGSYGTDNVNAVTGEATGGDTAAPGSSYLSESWDNTNLANSATESKYNRINADGSTFTSDVITQTDGSIVGTWSRSDGSYGTDYTTTSASASDTYAWSADQGQDTIQATAGNDTLDISGSISADQLWFSQDGNNLDITILGSSGQMTVEDWFANGASGLQGIELSNGQTLAAANVNALVQAMAAFAPPTAGQLSYTAQEQTALAPVLAANWH